MILLVVSKLITMFNFSFLYTGNDDLVFWEIAKDYSHGIFQEPFMYGQNYNYALESLLATPLIKLGMSYQYALPITTALMGVFPFVLFAIGFFRKKWFAASFIFLLVPIAMPIEYDIMTTITRGFINGLFFCSFLIFPVLFPSRKSSFLIFGLFVALGYITNPNSLVFSFPIGIYLFLSNFKDYRFYVFVFLGAIFPLVLFYFSKQFYLNNPEYEVHSMWDLTYSFQRIGETFYKFDRAFKYLTPFFWFANWWIVPVIFILGLGLIKRNWRMGTSILLAGAFIIFSLGVNKVEEGIDSVFFSASRMFLALPLLLALVLSFLLKNNSNKKVSLFILICGIAFITLKILFVDTIISKETNRKSYGPIAIIEVEALRKECIEIHQIARKYEVDLIINNVNSELNNSEMSLTGYGCPLLIQEFSPITLLKHDRRNRKFQSDKNKVPTSILVINYKKNIYDSLNNEVIFYDVKEIENCVLITHNKKPIIELTEKIGLEYLRDK